MGDRDTLFLFIEKEEDEKEFANAELIYTGLTRARRNLIIFNLANHKYDDFFRQEIETVYDELKTAPTRVLRQAG